MTCSECHAEVTVSKSDLPVDDELAERLGAAGCSATDSGVQQYTGLVPLDPALLQVLETQADQLGRGRSGGTCVALASC